MGITILVKERVARRQSWIFDGCGGMRDQLEQTILQCLQEKEYPLKVKIETVKSGGIFGSKDQCVVIETGKATRIAISNTTVGKYLYVGTYLLERVPINNASVNVDVVEDIFVMQQKDAVYAAAIEAAEYAFATLGLKQCNSGYKR